MDAKERIRQLMAERGWSEYRLAIEAGLSQSIVANIFNRNTIPSLAQFFAEHCMVELTEEQRNMFNAWSSLNRSQKEAVEHLIRVMKES